MFCRQTNCDSPPSILLSRRCFIAPIAFLANAWRQECDMLVANKLVMRERSYCGDFAGAVTGSLAMIVRRSGIGTLNFLIALRMASFSELARTVPRCCARRPPQTDEINHVAIRMFLTIPKARASVCGGPRPLARAKTQVPLWV